MFEADAHRKRPPRRGSTASRDSDPGAEAPGYPRLPLTRQGEPSPFKFLRSWRAVCHQPRGTAPKPRCCSVACLPCSRRTSSSRGRPPAGCLPVRSDDLGIFEGIRMNPLYQFKVTKAVAIVSDDYPLIVDQLATYSLRTEVYYELFVYRLKPSERIHA